jgi:hypothetical protein
MIIVDECNMSIVDDIQYHDELVAVVSDLFMVRLAHHFPFFHVHYGNLKTDVIIDGDYITN